MTTVTITAQVTVLVCRIPDHHRDGAVLCRVNRLGLSPWRSESGWQAGLRVRLGKTAAGLAGSAAAGSESPGSDSEVGLVDSALKNLTLSKEARTGRQAKASPPRPADFPCHSRKAPPAPAAQRLRMTRNRTRRLRRKCRPAGLPRGTGGRRLWIETMGSEGVNLPWR